MLILSRKPGESIHINDEIEIKIIDTNGDKVKIGIDAPMNARILRGELRQTIASNKTAAASLNSRKLLGMLSEKDKNK